MNASNGARRILLHGLAFMGAGLVWGLIVPHAPYPRLAMGAHIQLTGSGLLFLVVALLLLTLPHSVGRKSIAVLQLAAWLTWLMALSEVANAWWGTNQTLPIAASQAGGDGRIGVAGNGGEARAHGSGVGAVGRLGAARHRIRATASSATRLT